MKRKIFVMLMCVVLLALCLASCSKTEFEVKFIVDGEIYASINTNGKETIKMPDNPEKEGYTFGGWYWDNDTWQRPFTANSLLDAPLSSDMSVYARWILNDSPISQGTEIKSELLTVEGERIYGSVSNLTDIFSFLNDITINENANYVLAYDIGCEDTIASKSVSLLEGDNTFYILVTNGKEQKLYTVTLRRLPIYTVSFETYDGTDITNQTVEEGSLVTKPSDPTRIGYVFSGWDYDFSAPVTENKTVYSLWNANTDTAYKVEYYLENLTKTGYDLFDTENLNGMTDTAANAEIKIFEHFTHNSTADGAKLSGNIAGDGSLILKVYYTRDTYTVSISNTDAGTITGAGTYPYGTTITITATEPNIGYDFGWYSGEALISGERVLSCEIYGDIVAKYEVKAEMANFNFISTTSFCKITGIKDKTVLSIVVPDFVDEISDGAFSGCEDLESLSLPFVGARKDGTGATHFGYIFGATHFGSIGAPSDSDNETCVPVSLKNIIITGGTKIESYAFYRCPNIMSVEMSDSTESIGEEAFYGCVSLVSVVIPDSVESIDSNAFEYCPKLVEVINKSTLNITAGATNYGFVGYYAIEVHRGETKIVRIDDYIFYTYYETNYLLGYVGEATDLTLPESYNGQCYEIHNSAFQDCTSLKSIVIPDGAKSIGEQAFYGCASLETIVISDSVESIGGHAFAGCVSIENVYISDIAAWCNIAFENSLSTPIYYAGAKLYLNDELVTNLVIPNGVESIGDYAFYGYEGVINVEMPDSVKSIGKETFHGCVSLKSVVLSGGLESIGIYAFSGCDMIENLTIPFVGERKDGTGATHFGYIFGASDYTYNGDRVPSSLKTVIITGGENISEDAFSGCTSLETIGILGSVDSIGEDAFSDCTGIENVYISDIAAWCNITFENSSSTPFCYTGVSLYLNDELVTNLVIPDGIESIGDFTFYGCASIASVEIPNSVKSIGETAFSWCEGIEAVEIPDGVESIGGYAFAGCESLKKVEIPDSLTSIGVRVFSNCSILSNIKYHGTTTQFGNIPKDATSFWGTNASYVQCDDGIVYI